MEQANNDCLVRRKENYMEAVPIELKEANAFVDKLHRHHAPVVRDKFRVGCEVGGGTRWSGTSRQTISQVA